MNMNTITDDELLANLFSNLNNPTDVKYANGLKMWYDREGNKITKEEFDTVYADILIPPFKKGVC